MEQLVYTFEKGDIPGKLLHRVEKEWRARAGHPHHEGTTVYVNKITVELTMYGPHELQASPHSHDDSTGYFDYETFRIPPEVPKPEK